MSMTTVAQRVVRRSVVRYSIWNRRRKADRIAAWLDSRGVESVVLVGTVGRESPGANSGIVEDRIIAGDRHVKLGINVTPCDTDYPFQIADVRNMPIRDRYVDFALASAIIEHVGGQDDQRRMVDEMSRVADCWVITTPNRWFPVESHTSAIFRHWSPAWRARQKKFTRLLSRREFVALVSGARVEGHWWSPTFTAYWSRPVDAATA